MTDTKCNNSNNNCHDNLPNLGSDNMIKMTKVFKLLGDHSRIKIVLACLDTEKSVSELVERTGLSQSLISHNLRSLKDQRILKSRSKGKFKYYSLDDNHIRHIITDLAHHILEH